MLWAQLRWPLRGISGGGIADEIDDQGINKKLWESLCAVTVYLRVRPWNLWDFGGKWCWKSTLFGLLTDTVRRDSGEILWDGVDILKLGREYRAKVGYMPQVQGYYPQMTATEFLYYMGKLKGLPSKVLKQRTEHLLTEVDLSTSANQKLGHFSCGMRQRALLAQAMLGNPPLLILDEPTAGVDPYERVRIRSLIARVAQNHIVLLATHIVSDIECIANQVLLMNKGNLLKAGTAAELISSIESKVAQRLCTEEEAEAYQQQYGLGLLLQQQAGQLLRLVGDQLPAEFEPASGISLEEVYLYYCSSDSII